MIDQQSTLPQQEHYVYRDQIPWGQYLFVALGLLTISFLLYAVIYPLNGGPADDWAYPYYGKIGNLTVPLSLRQFGLIPGLISETFIPGQVNHLLTQQKIIVAAIAFLLFHLTRRLTRGQDFFALLFAISFILYVPVNPEVARPLFASSVYIWVTFMLVLTAVTLVESVRIHSRMSWFWLIVSSVFGYMSIRAYESTMPVIWMLPLLLVFLPQIWRLLNMGKVVLWAILPAIATIIRVQFLLSGEAVYQETLTGATTETLSLQALLGRISQLYFEVRWFVGRSFAFEAHFITSQNFLLPSILFAIVIICFVMLYGRRSDSNSQLPQLSILLITLLLGLLFTILGGLVWSYLGISQFGSIPRAHFYAAPGQALFTISLITIVIVLCQRWLHLHTLTLTVIMMTIFTMMASHWYYQGQTHANKFHLTWRRFDEQLINYQNVVNLAPFISDNTLLVMYDCHPQHEYKPHQWTPETHLGAMYLYNDTVVAQSNREGILFQKLIFDAESVSWISLNVETVYDYSQIIVFECADQKLKIATELPPDLGGDGNGNYDPYNLIEDGFLPEERTRILRW